MAKRKRSTASGPRTRSKAAKERREANTSERGVDDTFPQLTREFRQFDGKRAKLSEKELELEFKLRSLRREVEQLEQTWLPKGHRLKDVCSAREIENAKDLDKLPPELWEKILDHLDENDLFPLGLSCKYFREKQKELVARSEQNRPESKESRRAFKTNFWLKLRDGQPVSAEYLQFCRKERVSGDYHRSVYRHEHFIRILAAFHGHLPLLQELLAGFGTLDQEESWSPLGKCSWSAARGGQLETLQWLKTQDGFELDTKLFVKACAGGHLEIIRWLRSEGCPWDAGEYPSAWGAAAGGGHLEVMKWLRSEGCPWDAGACTGAAEGGHLEILKWLRSKGCPWDPGACDGAARWGHLEILKWLRSQDPPCPWDEHTCTLAAEGGHLEVLKWLRSEGCPWIVGHLQQPCPGSHAASSGDFEMLKWLRSEGFPWHEQTWYWIAGWGNLEIMRWLRSEGCEWGDMTCSAAAEGGHLEALKWLRSEGCPWNNGHPSDYGPCAYAAERGHLEVLKWLRSEGCPWNAETCTRASRGRHLDVLLWAIDNGCPYHVGSLATELGV